ncbi:protein SLFN14-like [Electrophorus electricus]|uniref:protein SLFN14-like n=1 Tax=Electrophorus electricus TaxID=8005 RepID=UPI0015D018C1|nr:protein SLFN14-like [Electrophorus electricus]XP_026886037.2 protein SLFN14-like [Electrophorus electricus]
MELPDLLMFKPQQAYKILPKSTTFGEEARNKMDKQKREAEKRAFQIYICAILNSKGGVLICNITNTNYSYNEHGIGQDLEQCLNTLIYPARIEDFIQFKQQQHILLTEIWPWNPVEGRAHICSVTSGLFERSRTFTRAILPHAAKDFFDRQTIMKTVEVMENNYKKANLFYIEARVSLDQTLEFGEDMYVEFKSFCSEKKLKERLKETLPRYLSAFANSSGGFLFIGIDDKTRKVVGCGKDMDRNELQNNIKAICAKLKDIHICQYRRDFMWSPEVKVFPVEETTAFIIGIKIPPVCCAVFAEDPESWEIKEGTISRLSCSDWVKKMTNHESKSLWELITHNVNKLLSMFVLQSSNIIITNIIKKLYTNLCPIPTQRRKASSLPQHQ